MSDTQEKVSELEAAAAAAFAKVTASNFDKEAVRLWFDAEFACLKQSTKVGGDNVLIEVGHRMMMSRKQTSRYCESD